MDTCNAPRLDGAPDGGYCNHPNGHASAGHSWANPGPPEDHQPPAELPPAEVVRIASDMSRAAPL